MIDPLDYYDSEHQYPVDDEEDNTPKGRPGGVREEDPGVQAICFICAILLFGWMAYDLFCWLSTYGG